MTRVSALLASAAIAVGLAAGGFLALRGGPDDPFEDCRRTSVAGGTANIGGPFTLVDATGRSVSEAEAITGPTLVYFGYGFCPDICPTDLARNALAAEELAGEGVDVGQVFISIDPERDTPEAIGPFTEAIDPNLLGLTGSPQAIKAAADGYRVFYRKSGDDPEYYLMDHSTFTYLMAPQAGFLEFYPSDMNPEDLARSVSCFAEKL